MPDDPFADETHRPTGVYLEIVDDDGNTIASAVYDGYWTLTDKFIPTGRPAFTRGERPGTATKFNIWARATRTRIGSVTFDEPYHIEKGDYINVAWDGIELRENTPTPITEGD